MVKKIIILILLLVASVIFASDNVTVNDRNPIKGNWDFKAELIWEVSEANGKLLSSVEFLQINQKEEIFVKDSQQGAFYIFNSEGKFIKSFGRTGEGPGEYRMIISTFIKDHQLVLFDFRKVHFFSMRGKHLKSISKEGFPRLFIDLNRYLYVKESENKNEKISALQVLNLKKNKKTEIARVIFPKSLKAQGGGLKLKVTLPRVTGGLIITQKRENLYYGNNQEYKISMIDLSGKIIGKFIIEGKQKPILSEEKKRKVLEGIRFNGGKIPESYIKSMLKQMPGRAPYFSKIHVTEKGYLIVHLSRFYEGSNNNIQSFDIFSPGGEYLYHSKITLPKGYEFSKYSMVKFYKSHVYLAVEDSEGEAKLMKFEIRNF